MVGYLMALYSDYKEGRGGIVGKGGQQRKGEGRNREKKCNDGIT